MGEYRQFTDKELGWLKRLNNLIKKAPDTIFLFAGSGTLVFYVLDENNRRYLTSDGSIDGLAPDFDIKPPFDNDGGDW